MRRQAFTLVEVLTVVIIIGILATIGYPAYENAVEDSKARVSQTNLKALKAALDIYIMEYDQVPGDLTQIPAKYIEDAYAQVIKQEGVWKIKLAYFIAGLQKENLAYADQTAYDFFLNTLARGDIKLITDPSDDIDPPPNGVSYGLNQDLIGKTSAYYNNLTNDLVIIAECDSAIFTDTGDIATRHKRRQYITFLQVVYYGQMISKGSEIREIRHDEY